MTTWWLSIYVLACTIVPRVICEVVVLTDDNFAAKTKTGVWFVEFYAPWCGHCKSLAPTWEKLAEQVKGSDTHVAKVDATEQQKTAADYGVQGYPTLKLIAEDMVYDYDGERTLEALLKYVEGGYTSKGGVARPGGEEKTDVIVLTDSDFEERVKALQENSDEVWVVEFYAPWCGACKALTPVWNQLGTKYRDHKTIKIAKLDATAHSNQKDRFAISGYPSLFLFAKGRYFDYRKSRTYDALNEWIQGSYKSERSFAIPPKDTKKMKEDAEDPESDVIALRDDNFEDSVKSGFDEDWFIEFYAIWCGHCKQLKPVWELLATDLKGTVKVAKCEANQNKKSSDRFAVAGFPTLVLVRQGLYYDYSGARTLSAMKAFALEGYKNETGASIQPEKGRKDPTEVFQLTDDNFERRTQSLSATSGNDWFIEFGSIHCKPCQNLIPAWEWTAKKVRGKVSVGYVDIHTNPQVTARFSVTAYPTLMLISQGKMYTYNGSREVQPLQKFALKQGADWVQAKSTGAPVPPEATFTESIGVQAAHVATNSVRLFNMNWVACVFLFVGGILMGAIPTCLLCCPRRSSPKVKSA